LAVSLWVWGLFVVLILVLLALDLFVFHRHAHVVKLREAALLSIFWVALGLLFGGLVWMWMGPTAAGEYIAAYVIEKSLSVDNVFVFVLILTYFAVPATYHHRVLFIGVLGAIILRAIFIGAGILLIDMLHWVIYVFGVFLIYTGLKLGFGKEVEVEPDQNPLLRFIRRFVPLTSAYQGGSLFVRQHGQLMATPLFAVLVVINTTDVMFAVDSIPAVFAITRDPFIAFTSNAFAVLGLRALYFLVAGAMVQLKYLSAGLASILVVVGAKMVLSDFYHPPIWLSLGVIIAILAVTIVASLFASRSPSEAANEALKDAARHSRESHAHGNLRKD
jgi:tellurite resistance protein TerC